MSARPTDAIREIGAEILVLRGQRVMLDSTLAKLYGVTTRRLNEQVRRNRHRFPEDFLFELSQQQFDDLKSQNATSSCGRRKRPLAFTEHGAIMVATILNSRFSGDRGCRPETALLLHVLGRRSSTPGRGCS